MISVLDDDQTGAVSMVAFQRLTKIDAVPATRDDQTQVTTVEVTPLLTATAALINLLMSFASQASGAPRDDLIVALRGTLDYMDWSSSPDSSSLGAIAHWHRADPAAHRQAQVPD